MAELMVLAELTVLRGNPSDDEIAALVTALLIAGQVPARGPAPGEPGAHSRWAAAARPGPPNRYIRPRRSALGAWRSSALPR